MPIVSPAEIPPAKPGKPGRIPALIAERGDGAVAALGDDITVHPGILPAVAWLRDRIAAADGRPVLLGLSCRKRALVGAVFKPLGVTLIPGAGEGSAALGNYMRRVLGPAVRPAPEPEREPRVIVAAADASWAPHRPGKGAWAAVRDDGKFAVGWVSPSRSRYGPEEQALREAFRAWSREITLPGDRLVLLSDSVHAVHVMTEWLPNAPAPRFARERTVIRWVKGHNGHPLNEAADRLAVAARRMRPKKLDRAFAAGIARAAAEEFDAAREHWPGLAGSGDGQAAA